MVFQSKTTFKRQLNALPQMVKVVESDPFLLVPSSVFFPWLARRLLELRNVQLALARARPSNYGVSTSIIMHLIRHTCHSPIIEKNYLRDGLRDLRFEEVCETFGMFFLHDLDMGKKYIADIVAEDPPQCRQDFESHRNRKTNRFAAKVPPRQCTEASVEFPLGRTPTYHDLQYFLANAKEPWTVMRDWTWVPNFDQTLSEAAVDLFIIFTRDFMNCLKLDNLRGGYPDPKDLKEAMETWTVKSLCQDIQFPHFVGSNYQLPGKFKGPRDKAPNHLDIFFPKEADGLQGSRWGPMLEAGYLRKYFQFKASKAPEDFDRLRRDIQTILNELQCLPLSSPPGANRRHGQLWITGQKGIQLWTNPMFYKLVSISAGKSNTVARNKGVVLSNNDMVKRLAALNGVALPSKAQERQAARQVKKDAQQQERQRKQLERLKKNAATKGRAQLRRRSGKRKNKRVPPQRRKAAKATDDQSVASMSDPSWTDSAQPHFDPIILSTRRKRRVIISTEEEEDDAFLDAEVDTTQGIIAGGSTEQEEIDNVENYLGQEEMEDEDRDDDEDDEDDEDGDEDKDEDEEDEKEDEAGLYRSE